MNANIPTLALRLVLVALLIAGGATSAVASDAADQKIFLDPDTGDVMSTPPAAEPDTARRRAALPGESSEGKSWVNDDGADMYSPDPSAAPALKAVHCPDGSLRMGHAKTRPGQGERDALCAGNPQ